MDFVCDIDGTVADLTHRRHHLVRNPIPGTDKKTKKNWMAFKNGVHLDTPIEPVITVVRAMISAGHRGVFCSGRTDDTREQTKDWLYRHVHGATLQMSLYMRKTGDYRADDIIKEELLAQIRADGYDPQLVFDDRDRVVAMWRRNGIMCAQVAEGNF